jgi:hypothetical protein
LRKNVDARDKPGHDDLWLRGQPTAGFGIRVPAGIQRFPRTIH